MDFNRLTEDFQQWLESLGEAEVRAEVDAMERDLEILQRRRELFEEALDLKREWCALFTPDASQSWAFQDDQPPFTSVPVWAAQTGESDPSVSHDAPAGADEIQFPANSLAARLARGASGNPRSRARADHLRARERARASSRLD
jgi:hypothetical protein